MEPFLVVLLSFSAFFSASESSFFILRSKNYNFKGLSRSLISDSMLLLNTIVLSNTVVNIVFSSLSEEFIVHKFLSNFSEDWQTFISIIVSTVLLLVFGESLPKSIGLTFPRAMVRFSSVFLYLLRVFFYPVSYLLKKIAEFFTKSIKDKETNKHELIAVLKFSHDVGILSYKETGLIERVINFSHMDVKNLIIQRKEIIYVTLDNSVKEIIEIMGKNRFGKILVCEKNIDTILGFVHIRDIIKIEKDDKLVDHKDIIREPVYIPNTKNCIEALSIIKKNRVSFGIVIDEFGGTLGIITLNRMLDKISSFGSEEKIYEIKSGKLLLKDANLSLGEVKSILGVNEVWNDEEETVSYFVTNRLQKIPERGDSFIFCNYIWRVEEIENNRIKKISIKKVGS